MDEFESTFIMLVPPNPSASMKNIEWMKTDEFIEVLSDYSIISCTDKVSQSTETTAKDKFKSHCIRNHSTQTMNTKTLNASTFTVTTSKCDAVTQVQSIVKDSGCTVRPKSREKSTLCQMKPASKNVACSTKEILRADIGVNTISSNRVCTYSGGNEKSPNENKITLEQYREFSTRKTDKINANELEDQSFLQHKQRIEYLQIHLKRLKNLMKFISKQQPSKFVCFTERYLEHISRVNSKFLNEISSHVIEQDKIIMAAVFESNELWDIASDYDDDKVTNYLHSLGVKTKKTHDKDSGGKAIKRRKESCQRVASPRKNCKSDDKEVRAYQTKNHTDSKTKVLDSNVVLTKNGFTNLTICNEYSKNSSSDKRKSSSPSSSRTYERRVFSSQNDRSSPGGDKFVNSNSDNIRKKRLPNQRVEKTEKDNQTSLKRKRVSPETTNKGNTHKKTRPNQSAASPTCNLDSKQSYRSKSLSKTPSTKEINPEPYFSMMSLSKSSPIQNDIQGNPQRKEHKSESEVALPQKLFDLVSTMKGAINSHENTTLPTTKQKNNEASKPLKSTNLSEPVPNSATNASPKKSPVLTQDITKIPPFEQSKPGISSQSPSRKVYPKTSSLLTVSSVSSPSRSTERIHSVDSSCSSVSNSINDLRKKDIDLEIPKVDPHSKEKIVPLSPADGPEPLTSPLTVSKSHEPKSQRGHNSQKRPYRQTRRRGQLRRISTQITRRCDYNDRPFHPNIEERMMMARNDCRYYPPHLSMSIPHQQQNYMNQYREEYYYNHPYGY